MTIQLLLTTAGADTGPLFDLYHNAVGPTTFTILESDVPKIDLTNPLGYSVSGVPSGTTVIRVQSKGVCPNYIDIILVPDTTSTTTTLPVGPTCQCYAISASQDPLFPTSGVTFFYVDCNDVFTSIYLDPNDAEYICSKVVPTGFPSDRALVNLLESTSLCGGCPPSSSTTTTTTTAPFLSYDLYLCGTSTPAGSRVNFIAPGQYVGGEIILGSNNECYTVVAPSTLPSNITALSEHGTCEDCQAAIPS
jgi:hypothetical protein